MEPADQRTVDAPECIQHWLRIRDNRMGWTRFAKP